jgi:hypothetical protein
MGWRGLVGLGAAVAIGVGAAGCCRSGTSGAAGDGPTASPAGTPDGIAGVPDPPPAVAEEPMPEAPAPPVLTGPAKHEYTSVALHGDCRRLDTPPEGEPDIAGEYDCPGFAGYQVRIGTADLRSSLSLVKDGQSIHFGSDPEYREPGQFAYVTDKVIEWRYREADGEAHAHALIFRVFGQDPETFEDVSHLIVARLAGTRACVLGTTSSNKDARKLADDAERSCP